ncbi:MAG: chitobiase/beta-hexosaminidase C-terminal domain-containing protein [Bacteroidales bacterium]|nr:chitobiase/beta-hexosaminidase C-terminal domain-containing protein [Bacteroidales bacterium]
MKKFLLSLVAFVAALSVSATETTFDFTDPIGLNPAIAPEQFVSNEYVVNDLTFTNGNVAIKFEKGTASNNCRLWYNATYGYDVRSYTGSIITITATGDEKISTITFAGSDVANLSANVGEVASGVWTGNAAQIVFNPTKTVKISTITITTVASGEITVAAPSITPAGGYFYNGIDTPVDVEIACATADAKIFYAVTTGEETPSFKEYTGKFQVAETCTVTAYAELSGVKSTESSAYFTIQDIQDVNSIDAFMALEDNTVARINHDLRVAFASTSKGEAYVTDGMSNRCLLVYSRDVITAKEYKEGDVIAAGVVGTKTTYNGVAQLQYAVASTFADGVAGPAVEPWYISLNEITADHYNYFVTLKDVTLEGVSGTNATAKKGEATLALFNRYANDGVAYPSDLNSTYAVKGFLVLYKGAIQMYPIEFMVMSAVEGVEETTATIIPGVGTIYVNGANNASVYNAAGQVVVNSTESSIAVAPGFYIVKAGNQVAKVLVK